MKVYIVFIAILIVNVLGIAYYMDYSRAAMIESHFKNQLAEIAMGAVYCINEEKYADGFIEFKDSAVIDYVRAERPADTTGMITIFDKTRRRYDLNGTSIGSPVNIASYPYTYTDEHGTTLSIPGPSVKISGVKATGDLYRLPGLSKTEIVRAVVYTWEERNDTALLPFAWY